MQANIKCPQTYIYAFAAFNIETDLIDLNQRIEIVLIMFGKKNWSALITYWEEVKIT